jgi:2-oxoglutarate dehydrogenase E1 component
VIRNHPSVFEIYQRKLLEPGNISKKYIDKLNKKVSTILNEDFENSKDYVPNKRD